MISLELGSLYEAEESLLTALKFNNKLAQAYRFMSMVYFMNDNHICAINSIQNAIAIDPLCIANKEVEIILNAKIKEKELNKKMGGSYESFNILNQKFPITFQRIEKELINYLYKQEYLSLENRNLPTKGNKHLTLLFRR